MWLLIAGWTALMIVFLVLALVLPMGKTSKTVTLVLSVLGLVFGFGVGAFLVYDRFYGSCVPLFVHKLYNAGDLNALNDLEEDVDRSECTPYQKGNLKEQVQRKKRGLMHST